ncbi:MAG: electron transport complex subunit RsxC [Clostridia bacterium]|nr:electron transport complex subunit RsxC [Clostridia bacterium]
MRKLTFKGGIHPDDSKSATNRVPIKTVIPPELMYYPVQQHIGAPLNILVSVGDTVKMGQKIADSDAYMCAPLHSSVSGTVKKIEPCLTPSGIKAMTIVIENDGLDTKEEPINTKPLSELSPEEIIKLVREAGIVGMGGAGFPTHVKLSPPPEKKITHVIVNGAECEPYLTSDHRVMLENPEEVISGLLAIMKIFSLDKAYIGIEENKPDAIEMMKKHASGYEGIHVLTLKKKYPQGAEKQLIYAVTGKEVPSGRLPMDVGCLVTNVDTVTEISRVVNSGIPLMSRVVTVSGGAVAQPANFRVRIGTPFRYVIEQAGGLICEPKKIIMGGPMMGIAGVSLDVPVLKGTSGILAFDEKQATVRNESNCLRCGKCVSVCPMNLIPSQLGIYANKKDIEKCEEYNLMDCIECGSCSYTCPAQRHLVQAIRWGKTQILAKRAKEKAKKEANK